MYSLITRPNDFGQPALANMSKSERAFGHAVNGTPAVRALSHLHTVPPMHKQLSIYSDVPSEHIAEVTDTECPRQ